MHIQQPAELQDSMFRIT